MSLLQSTDSNAPPEPVATGDLSVPNSRSFDLVLNTWPIDFTPEAVDKTYAFIGQHADMVGQHIDKGIPWPEAFEGKPFHEKVQEWIDYAANRLPGKRVYLAVSPINSRRNGLNDYWANGDHDGRPGRWKKKSFDDLEVITAYVNYCNRLIELFKPVYMVYGIEANMLAEKKPELFQSYTRMTAEVYRRLKEGHPNLPLSLSFHLGTYANDELHQRKVIRQLLPYTDYITISTYPYMTISGGRFGALYPDPASIPRDWLRQVRNLAPGKPFAVAETGFPAEPFDVFLFNFPASERWQADYVKWLFKESNALDARYVMWFIPMDYDPLWRKVALLGLGSVFKLFRDTGLADDSGKERLALKIWDAWRKVPKR